MGDGHGGDVSGDDAALLYAVDMARTPRKLPVELAPAPWPDIPADEVTVEVARRFARNIRDAMDGRSVRAVAAGAGIHHTTLLRILSGDVWPDLETISKLEHALDRDIWPGRVG